MHKRNANFLAPLAMVSAAVLAVSTGLASATGRRLLRLVLPSPRDPGNEHAGTLAGVLIAPLLRRDDYAVAHTTATPARWRLREPVANFDLCSHSNEEDHNPGKTLATF